MIAARRSLLQLLVVLALLWQSFSAIAISVTGCCEDHQPCCIGQAIQSACNACAGVALLPSSKFHLAESRHVMLMPPWPHVGTGSIDVIWRPPNEIY